MALTVLDAGILKALLDAADRHHDRAKSALTARMAAGDSFATPASVYAEILVAPFRRDLADVVDALLTALDVTVVGVDRQAARRAAELVADHRHELRLADAFVLATALLLHGDQVLTSNRLLPSVGVRRLVA